MKSVVYYADPTAADQGAAGTRTIKGLMTAIGSTKQATIVLAHTSSSTNTTYTVSTDLTVSSNITVKVDRGALVAPAAGKTLTISGTLDAGFYQIFSGAGTVAYSGKKYPEWWGAKDDSGTTDNTDAINSALAAGGEVVVTAPNGGSYRITDTLTQSVAKTKFYSHNKAEIVQATSAKGGVTITASNCSVKGIKWTGPQSTALSLTEKAINAYGADSSSYITNLEIEDNDILTWGGYGVYLKFVSDFKVNSNYIYSIYQGGIQTLSALRGTVDGNEINYITNEGGTLTYSYGIAFSLEATDSLATNPRSSYITCSNNIVRNNELWEAIDTHAGSHISFVGNQIYNCKYGIAIVRGTNVAGAVTYAPLNISVVGNTIDSGLTDGTYEYGISFTGALSTQSGTGSIVGNTIIGYGNKTNGAAIYTHTTDGLIISGNSILRPGYSGIYCSAGSRGLLISGNTIHDAWSDTLTTPFGIYTTGLLNTITIDGNYFTAGDYASGGTKTYDFADGVAIAIHNDATNIVQVGKNYITGVKTYLSDGGYHASKIYLANAATSGTGEDTLATLTIPAGSIGIGGGIRIVGAGTKTGANGNKTLKLYFGTDAFTFNAAANDTNDWRVVAEVFNSSATNTQKISWIGHNGATPLQGYDGGTQDTTAAVIVKITGECAHASDTITSTMFYIERL